MIITQEIINQPYSGAFKEKIYDPFQVGHTQSWTWIKFTESDGYQWCGQFRGFPREVVSSKFNGRIAILTESAFYLIENENGDLIHCIINDNSFKSLTLSPDNKFILANDFEIYWFDSKSTNFINIDSPVQLDSIKFKQWNNQYLSFEYEDYADGKTKLMYLDSKQWNVIPNNI